MSKIDMTAMRYAQLQNQMKELGAVMDGFLRGCPIIDRLMRDHFAGQCAAAACWASPKEMPAKEIARKAFDVAEAMMKERAKRRL